MLGADAGVGVDGEISRDEKVSVDFSEAEIQRVRDYDGSSSHDDKESPKTGIAFRDGRLILCGKHFTNRETVEKLVSAINNNPHITKLELIGCAIGLLVAQALAELLRYEKCKLTSLICSSEATYYKQTDTILRAVEQNRSLQHLDLSHSSLNADSVARMLMRNTTLRSLRIRRKEDVFPGIGAKQDIAEDGYLEMAVYLSLALAFNNTLQRLDVTGFFSSLLEVRLFAAAIAANNTLLEVVGFPQQHIGLLESVTKRNQQLLALQAAATLLASVKANASHAFRYSIFALLRTILDLADEQYQPTATINSVLQNPSRFSEILFFTRHIAGWPKQASLAQQQKLPVSEKHHGEELLGLTMVIFTEFKSRQDRPKSFEIIQMVLLNALFALFEKISKGELLTTVSEFLACSNFEGAFSLQQALQLEFISPNDLPAMHRDGEPPEDVGRWLKEKRGITLFDPIFGQQPSEEDVVKFLETIQRTYKVSMEDIMEWKMPSRGLLFIEEDKHPLLRKTHPFGLGARHELRYLTILINCPTSQWQAVQKYLQGLEAAHAKEAGEVKAEAPAPAVPADAPPVAALRK